MKYLLILCCLTAACESEETTLARQRAKHPVTHDDSLLAKGYKLGYDDGYTQGHAQGQAVGMVIGGGIK